ncbi:hypothetical protein [Streptomyces sp. HUAS TT20]|uniref:hypothetical protein n=1 Tax=Streptomyces sp. HUAS TT20 TaxID=3447509 RepID=UPI0021D9FBE5|nr:hypothetical protein [Streptomyces sp. HUAS 15-9]UXY32436.1 hypothetical protein N8I87_42145 [Streptomyces sp. HUAS 15-9]
MSHIEEDGRRDRLPRAYIGPGTCSGRPSRLGRHLMPEWIPQNIWAKFDVALQREILGVRPAEVAVLIVLAPSADRPSGFAAARGEAVDALRRAFGRRAESVVDAIVAAGGYEIREFWLNDTIAARLAVPSLLAVARRPEVRQVLLDSPRQTQVASEH